ncbi:MAG: FtsQ-type POTRA domain-containing protein [Nitrospira sp.]|nr:FtsQ-type POTRA domain-containing protein [Nitrospira sp.]
MSLFMRKRSSRVNSPRTNQWKGERADQVAGQRKQARREKLRSQGRRVFWVGQWLLGVAALAWGVVVVTQEMGPVFQQWLEIREVEVAGIRHVTKPEVVELLGLKPGMGLHQVSTSFLAERVRTHAWIKEATVERRPLHLLHVTVVERTPAAIVRIGAEHWVSDENGYLLAKLGRQDDATLPLLVGLESKSLVRGEARVRAAVQSGVVLARRIANTIDGRVEVDFANPASVVVSANGVRFQFGNEALLAQWERFQTVKPSFRSAVYDGRKFEGSEIDLRYDNRVIVRERG